MGGTVTDLNGVELITIKQMAKASGVCASSIRGFEAMGLLRNYGVTVVRNGTWRYFYKRDALKLAQIKADRKARRDSILRAQTSNYGYD